LKTQNLKKHEIKSLLKEDSTIRCLDIELLLDLDSDIEIYKIKDNKYLGYLKDENFGIIYNSLDDLKKVTSEPENEVVYEDWLKEMKFLGKDLKQVEVTSFPLLSKLIKVDSIIVEDNKHVSKLEKKIDGGCFQDYNPILYKELLLYMIKLIKQKPEKIDIFVNIDFDVFIMVNKKEFSLCLFIWNNIFEPYPDLLNNLVFYLKQESLRK